MQINSESNRTDTWSKVESEEETEPVCHICNGARFVHPFLPNGKPDYSQVVACRCVEKESDDNRQSRLHKYSNLGLLVYKNFDNLLPDGISGKFYNHEQFKRAREAARKFAEDPKGWLVLYGPSGCGKTHIGAAIVNYRIQRNHPAFYITTPDLLDHLRSSFSPNTDIPYDEFFEQIRNTPLLILDDLGAQSSTPWAKEKLDQLISHRYNNQLPTVIISIVPLEDLDERIHSRLISSDLCQAHIINSSQDNLYVYSWAPHFVLQQNMTFDNFDRNRVNLPLEIQQNLEMAYNLAVEFANSPDGWLVFQGVNGCGKTHLSAAIVNYRYQHNNPALFIVVPDFLDYLRSTFSPESKISYDQLFESVRSTPLLVLDDFGEQTTTPWAEEKLYQVINHRYNARLSTVITTCCSTDEIDSPIRSRFIDPKISMIFNIKAPDFRGDQPSQKRTPRSRKKSHWS